MSYISCDKIDRSEFYENISAKDKLDDIAYNQIQIKIKRLETENGKLADENKNN